MYKKSTSELLLFDPETERSLFMLKRDKVDNPEMEDHNSDMFNEGHSNQNEIPGIREPTLGDYWRPMMNENYSRIQHQPIDTNNFNLKPTLISMVKQPQFGASPSEDPNGHCRIFCNCVALSR